MILTKSHATLMIRRAELDRNYIIDVLSDIRYEGVKNIIDIGNTVIGNLRDVLM